MQIFSDRVGDFAESCLEARLYVSGSKFRLIWDHIDLRSIGLFL